MKNPKQLNIGKKLLPSKVSFVPTVAITTAVTAASLYYQTYDHLPYLFKELSPNVLTVKSITLNRDPFSPTQMIEHVQGMGTGFSFIGKDYIITNAHVVKDSFTIKINDYNVNVNKIGEDEIHDIAVLELPPDLHLNLKPLKKCTNASPDVGTSVFAIGNPFGLDLTLTSGIISGINRTIESADNVIPLTNLLQTDAAINPGNSGGPLFDKSGCLLGMNTAILSPNGGSAGIGFAIPTKKIEEIANNMIHNTQQIQGRLGITLLPDKYASLFDIEGVIVAEVIPDGIADKIGIIGTSRDENGKPVLGDIIIGINDKPVKNRADLYSILDTIDNFLDIKIDKK